MVLGPDVDTNNSPLVQLVERRTVNPYVAGSSPAGGAILEKASSHDEAFSYLTLLLCAKAMSQPNRRTALAGRVESRRGATFKKPSRKTWLFSFLAATYLYQINVSDLAAHVES